MKRMLGSLLNHSEHAVINLLVLTDKKTKPWVISTISNLLARQITEGVVFGYQDNNITLRTEYLGGKVSSQTLIETFFAQTLIFLPAPFQINPWQL